MVATPRNIRKQVLPNGVTILSEEMQGIRSVAIGVWVKTGSRHESVEPAEVSHHVHARSHEEVIRVAEDDLCPERAEFIRRAAFHGRLRADRHEDRRLDRAVRGHEPAAASL